MCGINGIAAFSMQTKISEKDVRSMLPLLHHRGPDGNGIYLDPYQRTGLGHARLSIIDLAGGAQPMHNEDQTIWVTFNGEIFNYVELRKTLVKAGHSFHTQSDTEVIVHAYEQYGDDFVQHLNGQFAIALWDSNNQRLLLVRDRAGILPLFYTRQGDRLLFASEIKALLPQLSEAPRIPRQRWIRSSLSGLHTALIRYLKIYLKYPRTHAGFGKRPFARVNLLGLALSRARRLSEGSDAELTEQLYELLADATPFVYARTCRSAPIFQADLILLRW